MVNDRLGPLIDDVQQVNGTIQPVPSAAQRLAVQRNQSQAECRCRLGQNHRNPTRQGVLQRGGIDLRQQLPQTARRRRRPLEPQRMKKVNGLFSTTTDRWHHSPGSSEEPHTLTAVRVAANTWRRPLRPLGSGTCAKYSRKSPRGAVNTARASVQENIPHQTPSHPTILVNSLLGRAVGRRAIGLQSDDRLRYHKAAVPTQAC